jgi:predicted amidophosphoribosyltransferase
MNLQEDLNFCPECEAKLEYSAGAIACPNCGWEADEAYVVQYEHSHGYEPGGKNR